jgi:cytochrome c oxidase subunit II
MKILRLLRLMGAVAAIIVISFWIGQQAYGWMPPQATYEAQQVDKLFSFLVSLGSAIFLGVTGMIGWSLLTCRAKCGDFSEGHPSRGDTRLEILWTVGPTVLVIWIALQSQGIYQLLSISGLNTLRTDVKASEMQWVEDTTTLPTIEVIAKQWNWTFHYPDQNITSQELHLPAGQAIKLVLESKDVLHGFYVPEFRIKQDIIPNRKINFVVKPERLGKYRLHDSQFSGTYFALMTADVYVETPQQFRDWLSRPTTQQNPTPAEVEHAQMNGSSSRPLLGSRWPTVVPKQFAT